MSHLGNVTEVVKAFVSVGSLLLSGIKQFF